MINTLTLNPAIDKMLYIKHFEKNITTRIQHTEETIGGKGTHVSINLKLLGAENKAFGIAHGETGKKIINYLNQFGISVCFNYKDSFNSRTNYLLIEETGDCTVVAEKGVPLSEYDVQEIIYRMKKEIKANDYFILSGDVSNCSDPTIYNKIMTELKSKNLRVFLDTSGDSLAQCISESPYLIKPNLDELSSLCGRKLTTDQDDIISAIDSLSKYNIEIIAVSLGASGSIIKMPDGIYKAIPPKVNVVNTVGCGDCFLSGLIYGLSEKMDITNIIKLATAISSATAESSSSVGFDMNRAKELIPLSVVTKIR